MATSEQPPLPPPAPSSTSSLPSAPPSSSSSLPVQQQPPASPPLPTPPTALTPGPRAARLQEVFQDRLKHTLAKVSYTNFASCFPTIAANKPTLLKAMHAQAMSILEDRCQREFGSVMERMDVVRKLNELETLVREAGRRRGEGEIDGREAPVPPHLLPPEVILQAHLAPHLAAQQSQLNARLQNTQAENVRLFAEIRQQREEVARLLGAVDKVLADVDAANALLDGVVDEVVKEGRDVEGEMAGKS